MGSSVYKNCEVKINDQLLIVNLVPLGIHHFDVILGMDWLSVNHDVIDCEHKRVIFHSPTREAFSFQEIGIVSPPYIISAIKAC